MYENELMEQEKAIEEKYAKIEEERIFSIVSEDCLFRYIVVLSIFHLFPFYVVSMNNYSIMVVRINRNMGEIKEYFWNLLPLF